MKKKIEAYCYEGYMAGFGVALLVMVGSALIGTENNLAGVIMLGALSIISALSAKLIIRNLVENKEQP
jgi:hypothetical protein